jgi:translation elongation factor EF-Tu-like GTPase
VAVDTYIPEPTRDVVMPFDADRGRVHDHRPRHRRTGRIEVASGVGNEVEIVGIHPR